MLSIRRATLFFLSALFLPSAALAQEAVTDPCEKGKQYYVDQNYIAAEPYLRQCLEQGDSLEALLPLTMITVLQDRVDEALDFGRRSLDLGPDNPQVRFWYGRALLKSGDAEGAMQQWDAGLRLDTTHEGLLEGLARLSIQQGNGVRAYNLFLQMRMQGKDEAWLHSMLSDLARRQGYWDKAALHWQDLVTLEGETEESLVVLGELLILAGEGEKSLATFKHAAATLPSALTWGGLGKVWAHLEQPDSAVVALRKAVILDPADALNQFHLANTLQILGDITGAEEHFLACLEAAPDSPVGHFQYGAHLELRGEHERARAQVERAVSLDSTYLEALYVLMQMYEFAGMVDEALSTLDRLERLDPGAAVEIDQKRRELVATRDDVTAAQAAGKVHLYHIITPNPASVEEVAKGLAAGDDFGGLATRFSTGPTAVRGGDIGWVNPDDMLPVLRDAIRALAVGGTSAPVEVEGVTHVFKRIR